MNVLDLIDQLQAYAKLHGCQEVEFKHDIGTHVIPIELHKIENENDTCEFFLVSK